MQRREQQIIERLITKQAFIQDYPKPGVVFLAIDALFNDPDIRKILSDAVVSSINPLAFDAVASIASRGYLFSGMIVSALGNKGEYLVQKVKSKGSPHYVQLDTTTEYSSDALQILNNTIQKGKEYLLTDDLIASGGSVITAANLIRKCGGEVKTVFVLTELIDLKARELLAKEGIELISLLKFTAQDLQKLLAAQQYHKENPALPMTYELTHHKQEAHTIKIHLTSQSPVKEAAVQSAFHSMPSSLTTNIITHDSPSGVNSQPAGYDETIKGATNRLKALENSGVDIGSDILVSMENGIRYSEEEKVYYDFAHVMIKKGDHLYTHTQDCCKIPSEIISAIRKENQTFIETWGEAAHRLGMAAQSNDPHRELSEMSRVEHLTQALSKALEKLKADVTHHDQAEDKHFTLKRSTELNNKKAKKYAKYGILFSSTANTASGASIDFYNQGCPITEWKIDPEIVKHNSFKVFSTGDAFSIIAPHVAVNGNDVNIHVGLEHKNYSPLVLLQEALQLCRCAYEHGATSITVAMPDQLHPATHCNDFNHLLMSLFKASGAKKVYFYDKNYTGKLDKTNLNANIDLTLDRKKLNDYLTSKQSSLDSQVMHLIRRKKFNSIWSKFNANHADITGPAISTQSTVQISNTQHRPHVILCCSANKPLAEKIAANLRSRGEAVKFYLIEGKGEKASIPDDAMICNAVVTIVQSTRPNADFSNASKDYQINGASSYLFEAAMVARQAKLRGAKQINLINPYQFSARSDKAEDNAKGKAGSYVQLNGLLLEAAGVNQVITAECHDNHTLSGAYTGKNMRGISIPALSVIATRLADEWISDSMHPLQGQLRLVTPDAGAAKRTKELVDSLHAVMGNKLCKTRVIGEKQRDSHLDISALITNLNAGEVNISPYDRYLITDDETATGSTLCQAITNIRQHGAQSISVLVVHNNMPLDWLTRQLCLARFFYLGANDIHFSDTQEMGNLAKSYDDLVETSSQHMQLPHSVIEEQVYSWFKANIGASLDEFTRFKSMFKQFGNIRIHSLADEFASKIAIQANMAADDIKTAGLRF